MKDEFDEEIAFNDDRAISMFDDEGNETKYEVLSSKEDEGSLYLLVAEASSLADERVAVMVLHFKCVSSDDDEMIFELVDEEHDDFTKVQSLFRDDYESLDIVVD